MIGLVVLWRFYVFGFIEMIGVKIKKIRQETWLGAVGRSHDDLSGGQWCNYEGNLECTNYHREY